MEFDPKNTYHSLSESGKMKFLKWLEDIKADRTERELNL